MQSDNYLPVITGIPPGFRKGRSVLDGYTRGWGLEFGDLKSKILEDPLYLRSLKLALGRTIQDEVRRMNIFLILKYYLTGLPSGNIIEFGCFRGGSCIFMAAVCAALGIQATVYGLDTFAGMPTTDKTIDAHNTGDFQETNLVELREYARRVGLKNLEFVPGPFEETAPALLPRIAPITVAHIDCDIRSSVAYSYETVMPYMAPGGYIIFDDAQTSSCLGATEAVEDLLIRRDGLSSEQVYPHYVFRAMAPIHVKPDFDDNSLQTDPFKQEVGSSQSQFALLQAELNRKTDRLNAEISRMRAQLYEMERRQRSLEQEVETWKSGVFPPAISKSSKGS
jgi:predicted O-methyltransferase YrrM